MAVKIQVKRGLETNLPTLSQGEMGFTTDSKKVFIGDGVSNVELVSSYEDSRISNNLNADGVVTISNPQGATYSGGDNDTGAIKITLPQSWTNTMIRFEIDVYLYNLVQNFKLTVGGYNYGTGARWVNYFAQILGNTASDNRVRFGHDGTKCCIVIGETTSEWDYPIIAVKNFQAGYKNYAVDEWDDGWDITLETNISGISFTGDLSNNLVDANSAAKLETARSIGLSGDVSGSASFDGSANATITATVANHLRNDSDDTTVGNITIDKTLPELALDKDAGSYAFLLYKTAGKIRWNLYADSASETGSNIGSNFRLAAYDDSGSQLFSAMSVTRSTGDVTFYKDIDVYGTTKLRNNVTIDNSFLISGNNYVSSILDVKGQNIPITSNDTKYFKTADIFNNYCPIDSGITDSGYRVGLAVHSYISDANFKGTLANQYGIWARHGDYGSAAGHINNSYGIFIDSLTTGSSTFGDLYGLYQDSTVAKNYFGGKVGIGTKYPSDKLNVVGGDIRVGLTTSRNTLIDEYGIANYSNEAHSYFHLNMGGGIVAVNHSISANGLSPLLIGSENYKAWHEGNDGSGSGLDADKVDGKDVDDNETSTSYLWSAGKIISYMESTVNGLDWQDSVKDKDLTAPPGSPSTGDRYIVASGGSGDWSGHDNDIAEYDGSSWSFITPTEGTACWVEDIDSNYTYNGSSWVTFGSTQTHNNLSGLQGGTSNEYYHLTSSQHIGLTAGNNTTLHNHDSRYFTESESDARFLGISANAASATKLNTARTIGLSGDVSGSASFDGSANATITATVANDSHTHDTRYLRRDATSLPTADETYDLGDTSHKWSNIHAVNFIGTATHAKYADLSEKYITKEEDIEPGTVISVSRDDNYDVEICNVMGASNVIGVVSTNPAFCMNDELEDGTFIALKGRVPCFVQGPVNKGDALITGYEGVAVSIADGKHDIALRRDTKIFATANESILDDSIELIEVIL